MTTIPLSAGSTTAFQLLCREVAIGPGPRPAGVAVTWAGGGAAAWLSPAETRQWLYDVPREATVRRAVWQHVVLLAGRERCGPPDPGSTVTGWRTVMLWLAVPRLRSALHRIQRTFGVGRADLESSAVTGMIEQLAAFGSHPPENVDSLLIGSALRHCWALTRAVGHEIPVADIGRLAARPDEEPGARLSELGEDVSWQPPAAGAELEGIRLGALAARLGFPNPDVCRLGLPSGRHRAGQTLPVGAVR
ncbi:hypothetical protein ACIQF6_35405 [Kitasatospora sp. NPDC092948]|uniref:hypothetical protein n=1 Tax=Kitasatospora sp. NPDC092948 TaxID=3364088 RepID=UPI00382FB482